MPFVPPKVNQNVWATHVPNRSPAFKVHSSEGLANSAVGYHFPGVTVTKYKLTDGEWAVHTVFEVPPVCDRCSKEFTTDRWGRKQVDRPYKRSGNAKYSDPCICRPCYDKEYAAIRAEWLEKEERRRLAELQAKYGNH